MAEVLDQAEVDALLAAVDSGQMGAHAEAAAPATAEQEVSDYDFKRPERVSKDQLRALEAIHEGFARNLGASLSGFLRTIIEIRVANIDQLTYSEFIRSLPNPTSFNTLEADGLGGQLCLEISPLIIFPIIDRLLGGANDEVFIPQRPLTAIELRLVNRLTDRALAHLTESWGNLTPLQFRLAGTESNPQLVQIVPPNEVVVIIVFEMRMGSRTGNMSLCIPFNTIEPLMGKLAAQNWFNYRRHEVDPKLSDQIRENIKPAQVEFRAFLARSTMTVSDLLQLSPGDVLTTAKPAGAEVMLQLEGLTKFAGRVGQFRGKRAIRISRRTPSDTEI